MDAVLTPSYHGEKCRYNGCNPDYETACDECDFELVCMPDWEYLSENYSHSDDRSWKTIRTSTDEVLEAFLSANRDKKYITETEIEIDLEVMGEIYNRQCSRGESINLNAAWEELTHGKGLSYFFRK